MTPALYRRRRDRRGVVLILILAMLGLLAVIGVMFATLSGQTQLSGRYAAEAARNTVATVDETIDWGLEQLINDTENPASALRGHSLKRDMYGNDAQTNGILRALPNGAYLAISSVTVGPPLTIVTNIPFNPPGVPELANKDFRRWTLRLSPQAGIRPAQTFEVIGDIAVNVSGTNYHQLTLTPDDNALPGPMQAGVAGTTLVTNATFTLDSRYARAFNGTGMNPFANVLFGQLANFRYNGLYNLASGAGGLFSPDDFPMDEDYDAIDLDNWFLAIRSADGSVVQPSFHRPGVLTAQDWTNALDPSQALNSATNLAALHSMAKIMRPRAVDHPAAGAATFPNLVPDATTGKIGRDTNGDLVPDADGFDVDNDGDGYPEGVWLDLGHPVQTDSTGRQFKPLYSFTVIGLNGKLPMNTAGNLNLRSYSSTPVGQPLFDHASHRGHSPSEINPKYAFASPNSWTAQATPGVSYGTFQLQKMLQGALDSQNQPVQGRWGEAELLASAATTGLFPRPGWSGVMSAVGPFSQFINRDDSNDSYSTFDFLYLYPNGPGGNPPPPRPYLRPYLAGMHPENINSNDGAGGVMLPAERFRDFLVPLDTTGNGRVIHWREEPAALLNLSMPIPSTTALTPGAWGHGYDTRGRSGYFMHFRPPGMPMAAMLASLPTTISQNRHNLTHGYESWRNPVGGADRPRRRELWGAMPWNYNPANPASPSAPPLNRTAPVALPTMVGDINSGFVAHDGSGDPNGAGAAYGVYGLYPGAGATIIGQGSIDRDNPDEMNPYLSTQLDAPFTPADLEWLRRAHDVDASTLSNRVGQLIPEAFLTGGADGTNPNASTARYHRELFTTESWDLNTYAWANDNPGASQFINNARFSGAANPLAGTRIASASFPALLDPTQNNPVPYPLPPAAAPPVAPTSIAHRGRRINLNLPLPGEAGLTSTHIDPVRQKWVRETYSFLKAILPPKAIDTPEELAQLSQYVLNIVDFRDPDGTMTKFVNTDVGVTFALGQRSAQLSLTTAATAPAVAYDSGLVESDGYLVQYGMEYQPVALNEVLAYSFKRKAAMGPGATDTGRFFMELVNTLTVDNGTNTGPAGVASNLALENWDIVVTHEDGVDDGKARPDPYTGQVPYAATVPASRKTVPIGSTTIGLTDAGGTTPKPIPALSADGNVSYHVLGYAAPVGTYVEVPPLATPDAVLRNPGNTAAGVVTDILPVPADNTKPFYWVYLRRPACTNLPPGPLNPMVVVDSMRFPYIASDGAPPSMMGGSPTQGGQHIWSVQRMQPFRGGQAVPNTEEPPAQAGTNKTVAYGRSRETDNTSALFNIIDPTWAAYGFSEQSRYSNAQTPNTDDPMTPGDDRDPVGMYDPTSNNTTNNAITQNIQATINRANNNSENWDPVVFHDRDFDSVAELLLVPACPPGLFTKQFVDKSFTDDENVALPPHAVGTFPNLNPKIGTGSPTGVQEGDRLDQTAVGPAPFPLPHTYPYLCEKFFYTPDGLAVIDNPGGVPIVGGPTGMGWHKMLEFFEVPSPALGAIGPVSSGENRDWYREDLRPGLVNLNLVYDEAVFFGLIDDPRLNRDTANQAYAVPQIVTQVDATGVPTATYAMGNTGYYDGVGAVMKPAFADFLKLRHANPNAIYGGGALPTQNVLNFMTNAGGFATTYLFGAQPEAPFHALSYPDIRYTLLRPADPQRPAPDLASPTTALQAREFDNGLDSFRNLAGETPPLRMRAPRIPRLRLFQIPDGTGSIQTSGGMTPTFSPNPASMMVEGTAPPATTFPILYPALSPLTGVGAGRPILAHPGVHPVPVPYPKNTGSNYLLGGGTPGNGATATATVTTGSITGITVTAPGTGYTSPPTVEFNGGGGLDAAAVATVDAAGQVTGITITNPGSGYTAAPTVALVSSSDRREHPYFRTEWLQKLMNNTTVRTHQFAVWVTVGYFEVTQPGDARLAQSNPLLAIDKLGPEIGAAEGRAVRHRSFFIVDRTRAIGFNTRDPGNFRDLVVHSRRIQ